PTVAYCPDSSPSLRGRRTRYDRYISSPGGRCPSAGATKPREGERSMDVLARLEATRHRINVLEHPFYERWSAGELSADELGRYAGEYRHAVSALARASELAAAKADADHST